MTNIGGASKVDRKSGFTIVELLIVIVAYNGIQARAQATRYKTDAQQIVKKAEVYKSIYGSYPGYSPTTPSYSQLDFYNGDNAPKLTTIRAAYWNEANDGAVGVSSPFNYSVLKDLAGGKNGSYPQATYLSATCTGGNGFKVVYRDPTLSGGTNVLITTGSGC